MQVISFPTEIRAVIESEVHCVVSKQNGDNTIAFLAGKSNSKSADIDAIDNVSHSTTEKVTNIEDNQMLERVVEVISSMC